jgi:hypothetical protein
VRLFFENGGGTAYIVSVGTYGQPSGHYLPMGAEFTNPNVLLSDLQTGLATLKKIPEVTMYICPEATLLSVAENGTLMQEMLLQNEEMQTAISVFDIIDSNYPEPTTYMNAIDSFRNNTGSNGLKYGVVYYPFLETTIIEKSDFFYTNLFGNDISHLIPLLEDTTSVQKVISSIQNNTSNTPTTQLDTSLSIASKNYSNIKATVQKAMNLMPPSGVMAGVMTLIDNTQGVWHPPANVTPIGVTNLPIHLTDLQQDPLNVDAVSGKSVNAFRYFNDQGVLVWGARTLDGNSEDWRYINVRRTVTMIEQSCKLAIRSYVFAPNNSSTWNSVKAMLENFLTNVWKEGALQGSKAADAFSIVVGLGSTMTSQDILDGYMRVDIKLAVVRPAEFIIITLEQQMAKS